MDLSPELFAEVVTATAATAAPAIPGPMADRRAPRARTAAVVAVCPWDDPMSVLGLHVRDFSAGGVGLLHRRRLPLDAHVVVRLPRATAGDSVAVLGQVVYWEPLAPEQYAVGVHFDRLVDEAELAARADAAAAHPADAGGVLGRIGHAIAWPWRKAS